LAVAQAAAKLSRMAITKQEVEDFFIREQERLKLGREVRALEGVQKGIAERIKAHVQQHGGSDRTTVFHGFVLSLHEVAGIPNWKQAYLDEAGADKALQVSQDVPPREQLKVEKAAA
jgi:hypothetical protein